jgi:pimeloyl-ACP methyl ester carboxylesterase
MISLFSSCNLYHWQQRRVERKMVRCGIVGLSKVTSDGTENGYCTNKENLDVSKPTLLLIHGYHGGGLDQWSPNIPVLSKHFNIVAPDLNYHGKTKFASDFSIEMQADWVHRFIFSLEAPLLQNNLIVIGSSYGGLVSARFCEKYADQVKAYVCYDGLSGCFNKSTTDSIAQKHGVPNAFALLNPTTVKDLKTLAGLQNPVNAPNFILKIALDNHFMKNRNEKMELLNYLDRNESQLKSHKFEWTMPVYVLWGENDQIISKQSAYCLKRIYQIPDEQFFMIPNAGHILNMENPKVFNQWVIDRFAVKD